jgi:hypothetical protein
MPLELKSTPIFRALRSVRDFRLWPIATDDTLPARRRFQIIADMDPFSSPNDPQRLTRCGYRVGFADRKLWNVRAAITPA